MGLGYYIWYSDEGPRRTAVPPSPLLAVPNVTAHLSTASVPITASLYDGPLLCGFNVAIKGLSSLRKAGALRNSVVHSFVCPSLPPTKEEVNAFARVCLSVYLYVCLLARLLRNACMDLGEILHVDRCRNMDELINV